MLIYLVTNQLNSKRYVGKTERSLKMRWHEHQYEARKGGDEAIHCAIRKYGPENFTIECIEKCATAQELNDRERYWIAEFGTFGREYNMTKGGEGCSGRKVSDAYKEILAERWRCEGNPMFGKKGKLHPHYGVPRSTEIRQKISKAKMKPVDQFTMMGEYLRTFLSLQEAATDTLVPHSNISKCCRGMRKSAGGYQWAYHMSEVPNV